MSYNNLRDRNIGVKFQWVISKVEYDYSWTRLCHNPEQNFETELFLN